MLDPNAEIEQFIHTGCGTIKDGRTSGQFSYWSASKGVKTTGTKSYECCVYDGSGIDVPGLNRYLEKGTSKKVNLDFREARQKIRRLKPGAKQKVSGVFKKKYYYDESDYEIVPGELIRGEVKILDETFSGSNLDLDVQITRTDFRNNPEKAPYRIVATKLPDGRLMVVRRTFVNAEYRQGGRPSGNYFDHAMIFPKGTEIEDLEGLELPFQLGLDEKYYLPGKNGEIVPPPEHLDTLHARDFKKKNAAHNSQRGASKPQQTPQTQQPQAEQKPKPKPIKEKLNMEYLHKRAKLVLAYKRELDALLNSEDPSLEEAEIARLQALVEGGREAIRISCEEGTLEALKKARSWIASKQTLLYDEAELATLNNPVSVSKQVEQTDDFKACEELDKFFYRELEIRGAIKKRA